MSQRRKGKQCSLSTIVLIVVLPAGIDVFKDIIRKQKSHGYSDQVSSH
jgi:hypothetical protein